MWHAFMLLGLRHVSKWGFLLLAPFCLVFFTAFLLTCYWNAGAEIADAMRGYFFRYGFIKIG
jgi:hypothetical protein